MSFYTSLNAMKNAQTDLGVISHNIANVETNGFKKSSTNFADLVGGNGDPRKTVGIGATVESITQNFALGSVEQTGGALDMAIAGDGFFTTRSAESGRTLYTRNGAFGIDAGGFVQDGSNNRLQALPVDASGTPTSAVPVDVHIAPVNAGGAEFAGVTVTTDGRISAAYADGSVEVVGRVALASFIAPTGLKQLGSSNWESTGVSGAAQYGVAGVGQYGTVLAGSLERSNVDIAEELVGLITAQRNFQANAKAIDTATQISQTVINLRT